MFPRAEEHEHDLVSERHLDAATGKHAPEHAVRLFDLLDKVGWLNREGEEDFLEE